MKSISLCILLLATPVLTNGQKTEGYPWKIYTGSTAGANVDLTLQSDASYDMKVTAIWCSLCDHNELRRNINQKGTWTMTADTLTLVSVDTSTRWNFVQVDETKLQPLFFIDRRMYQIKNDSLRRVILTNVIDSGLYTFQLFYETHDNGIVKRMIYRTFPRKREFKITVSRTGNIEKIERTKGKRTKVLN